MIRKLIALLLLLGTSVYADASAPVSIGYTTDGHATLGVPRYRGGRQGDTLVIVTAQHGSNQTGWMISYDRGDTWNDVRVQWQAMADGVPTWYSSDHSAAWFDGGLHIVYRAAGGDDPAGYRYVEAPYAGESDMETPDIPAPGTNTYYPVVVATGADDVWFFDMNEGSSRDNLRYWHTTDRFATSPTVGRVTSMPDDPQNEWRMGAIIDGSGNPKVSIFDFETGFTIHTYNRSQNSWSAKTVHSASLGGSGRYYCHTEMNGLDHIAYTAGATGPLVHFFETSPGAFDSTIVDDVSYGRIAPQFCVYGEGASARLYCVYTNSDGVSYAKSWTSADGWDDTATRISGSGHNSEDPAMVPYIPSSWDFIPIWYQDVGGTNNMFFVKLDAETGSAVQDSIPPDDVQDLGYGSPTQNSVTLSWTAPGDDGSTGTAAAYDIRYHSAAIDESNWSSATEVTGEPAPGTAGSSESFEITGLGDARTYYFAIKTVDESSNSSTLSNVITAQTLSDTTPPAAIGDLSAIPGGDHGSINLTWTATGDDGLSGSAKGYSVRYSTEPITPANWRHARSYGTVPTPLPAGFSQSLLMEDLVPDQLYYVAVVATDNADNESTLSNVTSAVAFVDLSLEVMDYSGRGLPGRFRLAQNYPNPFNPATIIEYDLNHHSYVSVVVYNVIGQEIDRLVDSFQTPGHYRTVWHGTNADNAPVASGVYFYHISTKKLSAARKMVLLR